MGDGGRVTAALGTRVVVNGGGSTGPTMSQSFSSPSGVYSPRGIDPIEGKLAAPVVVLVGLGMLAMVDTTEEFAIVVDCANDSNIPFHTLGSTIENNTWMSILVADTNSHSRCTYIYPSHAYACKVMFAFPFDFLDYLLLRKEFVNRHLNNLPKNCYHAPEGFDHKRYCSSFVFIDVAALGFGLVVGFVP